MNLENPVNPVRNISLAEKAIEDVLKHFGETFKIARRRYRQFVKNGIDQGKRPELQGGGLVRPACHARLEPISNRKKCGVANENRGVRDRVCKARAGRPACHARSMGILKYENVEREYSTSKRQLGDKAGVRAVTRLVFLAEEKRSGKREMRGYWVVVIL